MFGPVRGNEAVVGVLEVYLWFKLVNVLVFCLNILITYQCAVVIRGKLALYSHFF